MPGKLLAFSSPVSNPKSGNLVLEPESYISLFKEWKVDLVIRLNKPTYDKKIFEEAGIKHLDLYFPDGSVPSETIVKKFFKAVENTTGAIAIHCRAGLGRTGTLLALYLMKEYGFGGPEAIGFLRLLRPGCVLGIQ